MQRQQNLASHVEDNRTIIGAQTEVRGRVEGTGELRVLGSIEGDISLRGILQIEDGGLVRGDVRATQIFVEGIVIGDLHADVSIVLRPTAKVVGALLAPRLEVMEGAQFRGPIRTEEPATQQMAQAASAKAEEPAPRTAPRSSRASTGRSSRRRSGGASRSTAADETSVVVSQVDQGEAPAATERSAAPQVSAKMPTRGKKRAQRRETGAP